MKRKIALVVTFVCAGVATAYFLTLRACRYLPEASFQLASESRLPVWIKLPAGIERRQVQLTMDYYTVPWYVVGFTLKNNQGSVIARVDAKKCRLNPVSQAPPVDYPAYVPVVLNGRVEVIEHKRMEPIFYISDARPDLIKDCV